MSGMAGNFTAWYRETGSPNRHECTFTEWMRADGKPCDMGKRDSIGYGVAVIFFRNSSDRALNCYENALAQSAILTSREGLSELLHFFRMRCVQAPD